jgi:predicted RNA binding protein YcfA (HicA-like mRNA interferase family)
MTRIAKLYASICANPRSPVPLRDFERLLAAFGFELVRTKGSHRSYQHPLLTRPLVIQSRGGEAKPYQIEQFLDLVEALGLHIEP